MGDKIDLNLLVTMLNPAIFVILLGGLLIGYDTATLIIIGVVGYGLCFILRRIARNQQGGSSASVKASRKRKK